MRISCVIQSLRAGGAERQMVYLLKGLIKKGNICQLLVFSPESHFQNDLHGYSFNYCHVKISKPLNSFYHHLELVKKVSRQISEFSPDVIQAFLPLPNLISAISGKILGVPAVLSERNVDIPMSFSGRLLRTIAYRFAKKITCNSEAGKRWCEAFFRLPPQKIDVIPNGIDLESISGKSFAPATESPVILTVASFKPQKGHIYLIQALQPVIEKFPHVKCVFIGEGGGQKDRLIAEVKRFGLEKHIIFRDNVESLSQVYMGATIFCLPSLAEGLPNAIMEAMAFGLPVIATDVGGNKELVRHHETGLIVPAKDSAALSNSLICMLENPLHRKEFGENGKSVISKYGLEAFVESYSMLYKSFL